MSNSNLRSSQTALALDAAPSLEVESESPAAVTPTAGRAQVGQPLAATIPPELLMKIFEEADKSIDYLPRKQWNRLQLGTVCRTWYAARLQRDEYVVFFNDQAAALAETLARTPDKAAAVRKIQFFSR